jgi:hypothetical protein
MFPVHDDVTEIEGFTRKRKGPWVVLFVNLSCVLFVFGSPVESCYDRLFSNDVGSSHLSDEDDGSGSDVMMGFELNRKGPSPHCAFLGCLFLPEFGLVIVVFFV